jgi:TetR/AcrR family transcriptional regulator, transcriptional repressor of bet genes
MTRMPASQRRETIIAAAQRVVLAKGLVAATTRAVTDELGVGVGLLSHYFSWNELRSLAFERIVRSDLKEAILKRSEEKASVVLRDFVASAFEPAADPLWRIWIEATELASSDSSLSAAIGLCTDLWWGGLTELIARGHAQGEWSCRDPESASWRLIALLQGLAGLVLAPGARLSRDEATLHLETAIGHECQRRIRPRKTR